MPKKSDTVRVDPVVEPATEELTQNMEVDTKNLNANTRQVNLKFDVNSRKRWLIEHFEHMMYTVEKRTFNKVTNKEERKDIFPMIGNSYLSFTAAEQVVCSEIVMSAYKKTKKSKEGVLPITEDSLLSAVQLNPDLMAVFGAFLSKFDNKTNYFELLQLKSNELTEYVEKYVCDNSEINLQKDGLNYLSYLLYCNRVLLADCAYWMVKSTGKKTSLGDLTVYYAVKHHYSSSKKLSTLMCNKMDEVMNLANLCQKEKKEKVDTTTKTKSSAAKPVVADVSEEEEEANDSSSASEDKDD